MEREEYKRRLVDIVRREAELRNEKLKLQEQYILESGMTEYKIGEKVLLHKGPITHQAIVKGYQIDSYWHDVVLHLMTCKKVGTMARKYLTYHPADGDWVEKME